MSCLIADVRDLLAVTCQALGRVAPDCDDQVIVAALFREGAFADLLETNEDTDGVRAARSKLARALETGEVKKGKCKVCGAKNVEAHHKDYRKPLDVVWLCRKCHDRKHGKEVPEDAAEVPEEPGKGGQFKKGGGREAGDGAEPKANKGGDKKTEKPASKKGTGPAGDADKKAGATKEPAPDPAAGRPSRPEERHPAC